MKFLTTLLAFASIALAAVTAEAVPVRPLYRDLKLATQQLIEKQTIPIPSAAGTNQILSAHAGATSAAAVTVTTFAGQPDVSRNLVITPAGTTADVGACVIVVNGTNIFNQAISENFSFLAAASTATVGTKAFKSVTSVVFPLNCETGTFAATWSIGRGEKLGMERCMNFAGHVVFSTAAGAYETTRATVTANATAVELNTADVFGAMNGATDFEIFYLQNFRCFP